MFRDPRNRDPRRPPRGPSFHGRAPHDRLPVLMPPNKPSGSFFARHRREVLAVVGGAVAALGLWLFIGGPDRVSIGTGTFASPDGPGTATGVAVSDSADAAADGATEAPRTGDDEGAGAPSGEASDPGDAAATAPSGAGPESPIAVEPTPLTRVAVIDDTASGATDADAAPEPDEPPIEPARRTGRPPSGDPRTPTGADRAAPPPVRRDPRPAAPPAGDPGAETGAPEEAVPATALEARVAAEVAIAGYRRAVESGDLETLRRAHPGLTAETEAAWRRVFENGETFVALLRIAGLRVTGTEARAEVRGSCHFYDLSLRRFVDVPVEFELFLHHDGRTWRPVLASAPPPDAP